MSLLVVALDLPSGEEAVALADRLADEVGGFKVGLQLLMGDGPSVVSAVAEIGKPVFVDAKLHDIPNTVHRAAVGLGRTGARWVTAHASGGAEMLRAAASGLAEGASGRVGILAVTVLTSLDEEALSSLGLSGSVAEQVAVLSDVAAEAGSEGVVCSVAEAAMVRARHPSLTVATPGIRTGGEEDDDQARVATPEKAVSAGAGILVVGRPITRSPDPVAAARRIGERMGRVAAGAPGSG